jgi:RNA polymerase sigma-70 factor (ECF subfamily)
MDDQAWLAARFEAERRRLRGLAYRMLGSPSEADDAVQEAWLRLSRADADAVGNLGGWLTTVVARVCLDMLRTRRARREETLEADAPEAAERVAESHDPEQEAMLAEGIGLALLVVLQTLGPAERVAFVLHDMFDLPFEEIGAIVGRSATATRQLASRARRRVRGQAVSDQELGRQRTVIEAFLAASRAGDLQGLLAVLDPQVVCRSDAAAVQRGGVAEVRGAETVARWFAGRAQAARPALLDGRLGFAAWLDGRLVVAVAATVVDGRIAALDAIADPARLRGLRVTALPAGRSP